MNIINMESNSLLTSQSVANGNNQIQNGRSNLIVNYLPQSVKENDFNQLFSRIGPIKTCKLMHDKQTGYSFGYGFVEYVSEADAIKAIDTFNGYQIEHKRLKVALARPNNQETRNTNLYIRNIPVNYDEQQLRNLFSNYGEVVQVRILRDQTTAFSKRVGFVIMATKQMASNAIQNLNNLTVPNSGSNEPMLVKYADEDGKGKKNSHRMPGNSHHRNSNSNNNNNHSNHNNNSNGNNNNFGGNVQQMQNSGGLINYYNSNYMMNQQQNMSGGGAVGFNFNNQNSFMMPNGLNANTIQNLGKMKNSRSNGRYNPLSASQQAAMNNPLPINNTNNTNNNNLTSNNYQWGGGAMQQTPYSTNNQGINNSGFDNLINTINNTNTNNRGVGAGGHHQQPNNNSSNANSYGVSNFGNNPGGKEGQMIYVYGIGSHATESDLYSLFSTFGRISRVNVVKNPKTGTCKGYGFVLFETYEEACYAVQNMNGFNYNNRPLQVSLKMSTQN